jgi:subtilisin family serine protease
VARKNILPALLIVSPILLFLAAGTDREDRPAGDRFAAKSKIGRLLADELAAKDSAQKTIPVWVSFTDRGTAGVRSLAAALARIEKEMDPRCLWRRSKVLEAGHLVDPADLPLSSVYIESITPLVERIRTTSRWLNAVSAEVRPSAIREIARLPFVRRVELVRSFSRNEPLSPPQSSPRLDLADPVIGFYGPSFTQINQIDVWPLHRLGYSGLGVIVCMLDSGFRTSHEIFQQARLIAQHDFVNDDGAVSQDFSNPNDYSDSHGTGTWSLLGGYKPGELVGPAYGADFILAKTETDNFEQPIEEDYWVAGIEWAESLGAEVISSSLGYIDWYTFEDMDGQTAVTTRAANRATSLGVVVVNAAGNERDDPWGHIIAPADGFDVIACGAVDALARISSFSSPGPTYDGRIKPEVCALGVNNWLAGNQEDRSDTYRNGSGTSFSTPLIAGVAALILEIHRDWTPEQVRQALLSTASLSENPNNDYGWGIVDAALAADIGWASLALDGTSVDDDSSGQSLGDGDGRAESGETIEIAVRLKNKGRSEVSGLRGILSLPNPEIIIASPEVSYPPIPAGETGSGEAPFVVKIPWGFLSRPLSFWLKIEGAQGLVLSDYVTAFVSR